MPRCQALILILSVVLGLTIFYAQSTDFHFPAKVTSTVVPAVAGQPRKRPLLFVHGNSHGGFVFTGLARKLAAHGYESHLLTMPKSKFKSLHGYIDDIRNYIHHNMTIGPVLLGHSQGGLEIQHYLLNDNVRAFPAEHSKRAAAGVFLATAPVHSAAVTLKMIAGLLQKQPVAILRMVATFNGAEIIGHLHGDQDLAMLREHMFAPGTTSTNICGEGNESLQSYADRLSPVESGRVMGDVFAHLLAGSDAATPESLGIPTVTVHAAQDGIVPREVSESVAAFWGSEPVLRVDGQGHCFGDPGWEGTVPGRLAQWLDANVPNLG